MVVKQRGCVMYRGAYCCKYADTNLSKGTKWLIFTELMVTIR